MKGSQLLLARSRLQRPVCATTVRANLRVPARQVSSKARHSAAGRRTWRLDRLCAQAQGPLGSEPPLPAAGNTMTHDDEMYLFGYAPEEGEQRYGPPCLLLAGMRPEELPSVRLLLDELGGRDVKVIPITQSMLPEPLHIALRRPEPDWSAPRPVGAGALYGGASGAARVLLFSGLDSGERSVVIGALESRKMPRLAVTSLTPANVRAPVGETLAAAVLADRRYAARARKTRQGRPLTEADFAPEDLDDGEAPGDSGGDAGASDFEAAEALKAAEAYFGVGDAAAAGAGAAARSAAGSRRAGGAGAAGGGSQDLGEEEEEEGGDAAKEARRAEAAARYPGWEKDLGEIAEEFERRRVAGEDMSFMAEEGAPEPEWLTKLMASDERFKDFKGYMMDETTWALGGSGYGWGDEGAAGTSNDNSDGSSGGSPIDPWQQALGGRGRSRSPLGAMGGSDSNNPNGFDSFEEEDDDGEEGYDRVTRANLAQALEEDGMSIAELERLLRGAGFGGDGGAADGGGPPSDAPGDGGGRGGPEDGPGTGRRPMGPAAPPPPSAR